jgi:hypothetical protein
MAIIRLLCKNMNVEALIFRKGKAFHFTVA